MQSGTFKIPREFGIAYLLFFVAAVALSLGIEQKELHLMAVGYHNYWLDIFFRTITFLGDGYMLYFLLALWLIKPAWQMLAATAGAIIGSLATIGLKYYFYAPRPAKVFEGTGLLPIVEGVRMHHYLSFPSGHSTTAFAIFLSLAFIWPKQALTFFVIALITAYSRVYLSQHFVADIAAGSFVGVLFVILSFWYFERLADRSEKEWLRKTLPNLLKRN